MVFQLYVYLELNNMASKFKVPIDLVLVVLNFANLKCCPFCIYSVRTFTAGGYSNWFSKLQNF